jgi:hypothetical protein
MMERFKEKIAIAVAWALPRRVAYWAMIRVAAHATTGQFGNTSPSELDYEIMAKRWPVAHQ